MALIVQKYGGTSVGSTDKIKNVAKRVLSYQKQGHQVVVVLSAMSGQTDKLLSMAAEMQEIPDQREMDMLVSTGEQVTIALFAMAIKAAGSDAVSLLGDQVRILTDDMHTKARIKEIDTDRIKQHLDAGKVVTVAGFQGVTKEGNITTLGRGGSDTTAVALAAALKADACEIFTDVEGVYTTDPNICAQARKIDMITYDEMLELASLGARSWRFAQWAWPSAIMFRCMFVPHFQKMKAPGSLRRTGLWNPCWFPALPITRMKRVSPSPRFRISPG